LKYTQDGNSYTVSLPKVAAMVVGASVSTGSNTRTHEILAQPGILPWAPVIQRGVPLLLTCASAMPNWSCANPDVANISASGELIGRRAGVTIASCGGEIRTSVAIFELVGLLLNRIDEHTYAIRPLIFSTREFEDNRKLYFAPDLKYTCEWDAFECGDAIYTNGTCVLSLKTPRLCPAKSTLTVTATSKSLKSSVAGEASIVRNNPWGLSEFAAKLPLRSIASLPIAGKVRREDVAVVGDPPKGVDWTLEESGSDNLMLNLSARGGYDGGAVLTLMDAKSHEKIRIFISSRGQMPRQRARSDAGDAGVYLFSVLIIFALALYALRRFGIVIGP
jgi:hypothetical protein